MHNIEFGEHFISSPAQDLIKFGEKSLRAGREYQLLTGRKITLGPLVYRYEILEQLKEEKHLTTLPEQQLSNAHATVNFLRPSDEENSDDDSIKSAFSSKSDTIPMDMEAENTIATIPVNDTEFFKQNKIESTLLPIDEPDASDTTIDYEEEPHQTAPTQPMGLPVNVSQDGESEKSSSESLIKATRSRRQRPPPRIQDSEEENESDSTSESFPSLDKILGELEANQITDDTTTAKIPQVSDDSIAPLNVTNNGRTIQNNVSAKVTKPTTRRNPTRVTRNYVEQDSSTDESDLEASKQNEETYENGSPKSEEPRGKLSPVHKSALVNIDTETVSEMDTLPSASIEVVHGKRGNEEDEGGVPKKQRGFEADVQVDIPERSGDLVADTPIPKKQPAKRTAKNKVVSEKKATKPKETKSRVKKSAQTKSPELKKTKSTVESPVALLEPSRESLSTSNSNLESSFEDETGSRKYPGRSKRKSMYTGLGSLSPCSVSNPKVVFTGFTDTSKAKFVEQLGGTMEESWQTATHVVAMNIKRTSKFLCGLCSGIPIVSPEWVDRSMVEKRFVDETGFELLDTNAERQYNFRLSDSLMRARHAPLMKGLKIFTTKNVNSGICEIAEVAGAELLPTLPPHPCSQDPPSIIVIGTEQDAKECTRILKEGFPVYLTEFVSIGALRQELDFDNHQFVISKRRTTGRRRS
ncbi:hypothetical protein K493DRAFT_342577 [Basidiobolus meristosporus CBS 931.73]|uniref:BRCT domain-containing protein n=1 Tax=Basidiobolus meristosporus CBS 931.73 TaxID=1314790 RepID=A0A1Y1X3X9_9FUNG|nr:hypothetical protein K493DRAFT_342577 [Basidiobolus meristosporus CBS 931.73]|eukprot:ORX80355.1 hypothetical protein K493DRAFT_342577 [Basidiobolus meristosporus CBS 931.73]